MSHCRRSIGARQGWRKKAPRFQCDSCDWACSINRAREVATQLPCPHCLLALIVQPRGAVASVYETGSGCECRVTAWLLYASEKLFGDDAFVHCMARASLMALHHSRSAGRCAHGGHNDDEWRDPNATFCDDVKKMVGSCSRNLEDRWIVHNYR